MELTYRWIHDELVKKYDARSAVGVMVSSTGHEAPPAPSGVRARKTTKKKAAPKPPARKVRRG